MHGTPNEARHSLAALTLGAIGVVYGDIGTSPLYAFREALAQSAADGISRGEIIGILSLALWALIIVVTLKYVLFLSRMDNNGEGGVLSLMALAKRATGGQWLIVLLLGAVGAALFYGDAIITPALSVLSAVEGLKTIHGFEGMTVTGAEALIADMGHFGRQPIQLGWLTFVWPALTLNYLGQGALVLKALAIAEAGGHSLANADWFFLMAPDSLRAPLVVLATLATIIASQAVITGAYSLTHQAIALGLLPRLTIRQTSEHQIGQIYMPGVNWLLLFGVVVLVLNFRSSSAMAAA